MNRLLRVLGLAVLCALGGCITPIEHEPPPPIVVDRKPPPERDEEMAERPTGDVFWTYGHWGYKQKTDTFYWVPGAWIAEREGERYVPPSWSPAEGGGWQLTAGEWKPIEPDEPEY